MNLLLVFATLKEAESFFGTSLAAKQGEVFYLATKALDSRGIGYWNYNSKQCSFLSKLLSKKLNDLILNLGLLEFCLPVVIIWEKQCFVNARFGRNWAWK